MTGGAGQSEIGNPRSPPGTAPGAEDKTLENTAAETRPHSDRKRRTGGCSEGARRPRVQVCDKGELQSDANSRANASRHSDRNTSPEPQPYSPGKPLP